MTFFFFFLARHNLWSHNPADCDKGIRRAHYGNIGTAVSDGEVKSETGKYPIGGGNMINVKG